MAKFEKWLGAGVGYAVGGPIGGFFGYLASGNATEKKYTYTAHTSEFETSLLLLIAEVIVVDGVVSAAETSYARRFFSEQFDEKHVDEKMDILSHCIEKKYSTKKACDELRQYCNHATRKQIVHLLFEVAIADGALVPAEIDLIFKLAGWLNINDKEFKLIKNNYSQSGLLRHYVLLGVKPTDDFDVIKTCYRKLVLIYHPDKHATKGEAEQQKMAKKLVEIQAAFELIKKEKGK